MELDFKASDYKCPHCDAPGDEITYIEFCNKRFQPKPRGGGYEMVPTPKPNSATVFILFECGGETGYRLDASGLDCEQMDGEVPENVCPQKDIR